MTAGEFVYLIRADKSQLNSTLDSAEKDTKSWGSKISAWTVAKGQMIANVATKAVTKVMDMASSLVTGAVNAAAQYEQLVGGVDTLFKDSSKKVQAYAAEAYKNVGISANAYMQNVTSFSASLLQSLGNDTDRAAEIANMAMIDMADNANKMGTSMESIQNAYQGFAKQNYTMLDNLKLGYGGTKTEMERLLKDAEKLTKKKYDIKNLSDVYEAIHAIQTEMGIAGTTQKEAMETVEGSMNAAKAAWQDVLTAMGNGKGVKKAIKNFASTAKTALHNYAPVIKNAVSGMVEAAKELAPELGNIINEVGRGLFGKTWDITIEWVQNAWDDVQTAFNTAVQWVGNAYNVTVEWINKAWDNVTKAFNSAKEWVKDAYNATVNWINDTWDNVKKAFDNAKEWVKTKYEATVEWIQKKFGYIQHAFSDVKDWIINKYKATVEWIQKAWDDVKDAIAQVGKGIWNNIVNFGLGLISAVDEYIKKISKAIDVVVNFFVGKKVDYNPGTNPSDLPAEMNQAPSYQQDISNSGNTTSSDPNNWLLSYMRGFASGAWTVPYDMTARIHRGEQILTASQARQSNGVDYEYIGEMIGGSVERAISKMLIALDGNKVAEFTTRRTDKNIRKREVAYVRGMGG